MAARGENPLGVRFTPRQLAWLDQAAEAAGVSRNALISLIVDHFAAGIPPERMPRIGTYLVRGWAPTSRVR